MPRRVLRPAVCAAIVCCVSLASVRVDAARIEAVSGKRYALTKEHGPWMIMVATFHTTGSDGRTDEGKSPEQAADELVLELRKKGMPAYVYAIEPGSERISTVDRAGRPDLRKNLRRVKSIGVLAGNYASVDDKLAQDTLTRVKDYDPKCLKEGVVFQATEKRKTPLAGAFLTVNPLLSPEEVAARQIDPLLMRLNHGERNSLLECDGKFTLVVATFAGKSLTPKGGQQVSDAEFLKNTSLDNAAEQARDLADALRRHEQVEAFVWHDRYESFVTVGSFASDGDPQIRGLRQRFGAAQPLAPDVQQKAPGVKFLAVDASGKRITDVVDPTGNRVLNVGSADYGALQQVSRFWPFDPSPRVIPVPRKRQ